MKSNHRTTVFLILFLSFIWESIQAQVETNINPKNQIEFRHDNDIFITTDRYYSTGLFLTYRRNLAGGLFKIGNEQLTFQIALQAYTPTNGATVEIHKLDHPYAGFSGLYSGWSIAINNNLFEIKTLVGLTGPSSGAGAFQRWFHRAIIRITEPTWFTEIEDSFHVNLAVSYVLEWELAPNPFGVRLAINPSAAYGTKDVYAQSVLIAYFGRRNTLGSSIAYDRVGALEREIYFSFRYGYRYVKHNALLEGNLSGDNSEYTIESKNKVTHFGIDFYHRSGKNDYKFGYRLNSKEADKLKNHKYLYLSYARSF